MAKKNKPFFTNSLFLSYLSQINPAEIPIKIKSNVQTGAKTHFGGLNEGFIMVGYQVLIPDCVTNDDKYPTAKQIATVIIILTYLFILKCFVQINEISI